MDKINGVPGNLAVSVIVQDPNNTNIMYLGTGESYTSWRCKRKWNI